MRDRKRGDERTRICILKTSVEEELKEDWRKLHNKQLTVCATSELRVLLGHLSHKERGFKCGWGNKNIMLDFYRNIKAKDQLENLCVCGKLILKRTFSIFSYGIKIEYSVLVVKAPLGPELKS